MILTHLVLFSFLGGASASDSVTAVAETSGGWVPRRRPTPFRQREQTDEEIKAERVRMGIVPPDPSELDASHIHSINSDTTGGITAEGPSSTYSLAAHLLPEDLAGLEALAARAAQLSIDEEITAWLGLQRLEEQRRLYERDEDDAAVLMLAIATIH